MTTKHTHQIVFGKKVDGCPRCEELKAGAAPVQGWGARAKAMEARRIIDIRNHDCRKSGCGPVCTAFDW